FQVLDIKMKDIVLQIQEPTPGAEYVTYDAISGTAQVLAYYGTYSDDFLDTEPPRREPGICQSGNDEGVEDQGPLPIRPGPFNGTRVAGLQIQWKVEGGANVMRVFLGFIDRGVTSWWSTCNGTGSTKPDWVHGAAMSPVLWRKPWMGRARWTRSGRLLFLPIATESEPIRDESLPGRPAIGTWEQTITG